jgi:hypothetical protein
VKSGAIIDPSLKDTPTSPLKGKDMDADSKGNPNVGAKRNLADFFRIIRICRELPGKRMLVLLQ